jgi:organic radical activating enzyme
MRVNEIFYSIQGEGAKTGTSCVFIRLSGCNLKCSFCDTDFKAYKEMSEIEIVDAVIKLSNECKQVVITGGEPTITDTTLLIDLLHQNKYKVAMESNGTHKPPYNIDWLTISPKEMFVGKIGKPVVEYCSELKVVFDGENIPQTYGIQAQHYFLQPCDTGDKNKNNEIIKKCVEYIKENPKWRISLQTQKILSVR